MAKNIILLSDGTGNSSGKLFKTNAWRVYQALDLAQNNPDGTPAQIAYWESTLRKVAENDEFRRSVERNLSEVAFRGADDTRKHMAAEYEQAKGVMQYLGLIK